MALAIRLNDWNYLLAHDLIMLTKDGRPYRCGKSAYRVDWNKLIGKTIKLHQHTEPYTLLDRFKGEDGKWYLKVTDGQFIYTETQDRCKYNKKWSKYVVIEDMPQEQPVEVPQVTYQLCLPAPIPAIDIVLNEAERLVKAKRQEILANPNNYTRQGTLKANVLNKMNRCHPLYSLTRPSAQDDTRDVFEIFEDKVIYVASVSAYIEERSQQTAKQLMRKLVRAYHPDTTIEHNAHNYISIINEWNII